MKVYAPSLVVDKLNLDSALYSCHLSKISEVPDVSEPSLENFVSGYKLVRSSIILCPGVR